jgi:hypothetical protein
MIEPSTANAAPVLPDIGNLTLTIELIVMTALRASTDIVVQVFVPLVSTEMDMGGQIITVKVVPLVGTDPVGPLPVLAQADVPRANIRWPVIRVVQVVTLVGTDPADPLLLAVPAHVPLVGTDPVGPVLLAVPAHVTLVGMEAKMV